MNIDAITTGNEKPRRLIEKCLDRVLKITDHSVTHGPAAMALDVEVSYQAALEARDSDGAVTGVSTGYAKLDCWLGGLNKSNLVVLAAQTGMGKTALAMNIASNVAKHDNQFVAVFSMEMSRRELSDRLLAAASGINLHRIVHGKTDENECKILATYKGEVARTADRILLDVSGRTSPAMIRAHLRRLMRRHPVVLVIVDYLQLCASDHRAESQYVRTTQVSHDLKALAVDLDVPVLAISQFSREASRRKGEPKLSDLRDSGSIETDANSVVFIHHDDEKAWHAGESNVASIIIAKNRNGPTGKFKMHWTGACVRFRELTEVPV